MSHRYLIGDEVRLVFGFFDQAAVGTYGVTRLLPTTPDGEPQYRIKDRDGRERVIGEGQIARDGYVEPARPDSRHNPVTAMFDQLKDAKK